MTMTRRTAVHTVLALTASLALAPPAPAEANTSPNSVVDWDLHAQTAIWDIAQQAPPQVAGRGFAMVNGAVHDAVNAITGTPYEPYLLAPRANGRESTDAAVGTAAYRGAGRHLPCSAGKAAHAVPPVARRHPRGTGEARRHPGRRTGRHRDDHRTARRRRLRPPPLDRRHRAWSVPPHSPGFDNTGAWVGFLKPFAIRA
ncbi:hypothetical protein [Saccharothrix luteola]|uniref:hypothetical protein n=1 Tax=Saccharothrix luteola TaxID=2893018 RepID=UPI001E46CCE4|nr:hypothetical protein [Saccharothrix luteola]